MGLSGRERLGAGGFRRNESQERLTESARLHTEVYAEDEERWGLTDAAMEDWPQ